MKLAAASFLGGANSRLLPFSIPFRFFAAAAVFHAASWAALAAGAGEVPSFIGGAGWPLAATHLLTLGVLTSTAMGAAAQLLPVATRQPLRAVWAMRIGFWLLVPGIAVLVHGMAAGGVAALESGGALVVGGLGIFAVLLADNLRRATSMGLVVAHGWAALAALAALAVLGLALIGNYQLPILADPAAVGLAHVIVATFGFMGLLAVGFSYVLLPMFALSPAPSDRLGYAALGLGATGIALGVLGALAGSRTALIVAALLGLAGAGGHLAAMARVMKTRMRKRLGLSFGLIRAAWALLALALLSGAVLAAGLPLPGGVTLFGFVALYGWLLTFLMGVLQRIMPFLGSMHATRSGQPPLRVSQLTPERPLQLHAVGHFAALAGVAAGIALENSALVLAGALCGLGGALAFLWFAVTVIVRVIGLNGAVASVPSA